MLRKPLLIAAALAAAAIASVAAPAASAACASDATVSYVGTNWGPVPMWRVSVPSLNASWDIQTVDAATALTDVLPLIACPAVTAAPDATPTSSAAPDTTVAQDSAPVIDALVEAAPVAVAPVKIPAKAATAKHGQHSPPATAKMRAQ